MAIALVQTKSSYVAGYATSLAVTLDSNVTAGNLIDVEVEWLSEGASEFTSTVADTLSNTYTNISGCQMDQAGSGRSTQSFYAKNVTGGACTVTFTPPGNRQARYIHVTEWSGLDATAPLDQSDAVYSTSGSASATSDSITPATDGQLIISNLAYVSSAVTITCGETEIFNANNRAEQYEVQTTAAALTQTFTIDSGRNWMVVIRSYKAAATGTTMYFLDSVASGSNFGQLQFGGSAPSTATTATGWTVDTVASSNYALMAYASERASTVFSGTAQPAGNPDNSLGDCFRSTSTLTGDFATGVWTIAIPVIAVSAAAGQDGRVRVRLWRSANATGTSPTEITAGAVAGTTVTNLTTGAEQVSTVTTGSITGFSMANEYLFVQVAWEITGAAT